MSDNKFYLTTPIYYVNARPHIGHAYTTIVADVLARRHRLLGDDTYFLTGTDEHGQKIERSAAAAGIPPQQFADQVSKSFEDLWKRMGITNNDYIRTTDPRHKRGVQKLFSELYERGQIYLSSYTGQYSIGEEMFVEGPPGTIGPDGRPTETVTEENFFFRLSDYQLPLLNLIESGELIITPDSSRNEVLSFLRATFPTGFTIHRSEDVPPAPPPPPTFRTAAGNAYIPGALRDLSVSRSSFAWGIPVPENILHAAGTTQKHVIYVWLDALANYMTALGYGSDNTSLFEKFWPADLHLVGKEITRFHCVYWPAFLLAAGLPLPKQITAHGWLLFDNSKMSKSKGNIVRTETILEAFGTLCPSPVRLSSFAAGGGSASPATPQPFPESTDRKGTASAVPQDTPQDAALAAEVRPPTEAERDLFASDVLRYFLLREIPFGQDGSFSFEAMITRYNADLANGYGNLVSRTLNLIADNFSGAYPGHAVWKEKGIAFVERIAGRRVISNPHAVTDTELGTLADVVAHFCQSAFASLRFSLAVDRERLLQEMRSATELEDNERGALDFVMLLLSRTDEFLSELQPWKLLKSGNPEDRDKASDCLYQAAESIRIITALLYPILPYATARVWAQLGLGDIEQAARNGELKNLQWGGLKPGTKLGPLGPIFPRADKGLVQLMNDIENSAPEPTSSTDPAAGPRTTPLDEPSGPLTVGGSNAHTSGPHTTPPHTDVAASGIFANQPISGGQPLTTNNQQPTTPQITIDDFAKIELRVAQILLAERIPKADKLLRLEVDLGPHGKRQILSGIAEWYTPEDLIGRRIVVITNLAPRKMRGLESHGMLLAASEGENSKPVLATFSEDIALGSRLK